MNSIWQWIQNHASAIGVVLSSIALAGSGIGFFVTLLNKGQLPDLLISSPNVTPYQALEGYELKGNIETSLELCQNVNNVFGAGLHVELALSHNKQSQMPITIGAIEIIHRYKPITNSELTVSADADSLFGEGTESLYSFLAWLQENRIEIERWRWKEDGTEIKPVGNNLLKSDEPKRIVLRNDGKNDTEGIVGTIKAAEPGLYRVWLKIRATTGGKTIIKETDHVCIYQGSM